MNAEQSRGSEPFAAVREILADFERDEITESTAERRLTVVTRYDQRDVTLMHEPGLTWLHGDSSIPIDPAEHRSWDWRL